MKQNIYVTNYRSLSLDIPDFCIHCHKSVGFSSVSTTSILDLSDFSAFAVTFLCPSCNKFSVTEYNNAASPGSSNYQITNYSYTQTANVNLPNNIEKVSEEFVNIFKQAATAEAYGLKDICGVAYRKAAEFLIKDYVIRKFPENEDDIKNQFLGKIISDKLDAFPKIQTLAKATAWLGNDETHYVRKHSDKDLADLKAFLLAAATFIAADYDADEALNFINK